MVTRSLKKEIFDTDEPTLSELWTNMQLLARQNKWFLNNWLIFYYMRSFVAKTPFSVLDVGTGVADVPRYLARRFDQLGVPVHITAVDANPQVLELARREMHLPENVKLVHARVEEVAGQFDIVIASQMLHHLTPEEAVEFFRTACSKARRGVIVADLIRTRLNFFLVKMYMYITLADRFSRNDGPLSVLRSYSDGEIADMLHKAGIMNFKVRNFFLRKIIIIPKQLS
jgi:2-polyprenyl-3-methyl-5-hydroxy-6-metoxy-1,4-benzoquinol methylase